MADEPRHRAVVGVSGARESAVAEGTGVRGRRAGRVPEGAEQAKGAEGAEQAEGAEMPDPKVLGGAARCRPRRSHRFTGRVRRRDARRVLRVPPVLGRHRRPSDGGRGRKGHVTAGTGPRPCGVGDDAGSGRPPHLGAGTGHYRRRESAGVRARASARAVGTGVTVTAGAEVDDRHAGPLATTGNVHACGPARERDAGAEVVLRVGSVRTGRIAVVERRARRTGRPGARPAGIPCPAAHRRAGNPARQPWRVSCSRRCSRSPGSAGPPRRPSRHRGSGRGRRGSE